MVLSQEKFPYTVQWHGQAYGWSISFPDVPGAGRFVAREEDIPNEACKELAHTLRQYIDGGVKFPMPSADAYGKSVDETWEASSEHGRFAEVTIIKKNDRVVGVQAFVDDEENP